MPATISADATAAESTSAEAPAASALTAATSADSQETVTLTAIHTGRPGSPGNRAGEPHRWQASPGGRRRLRLLRWMAVLAVLCLLLGLDLARPPASQASARFLLGGIHLYQATLSPRLGAIGVQCRFRPTCSHYAEGAIAKYGALSGSLRAAWRIVRCGPWTPLGTYDPP